MRILSALLIAACFILTAANKKDDEDRNAGEVAANIFWSSIGGYVVIGVIGVLFCGTVSLFAWICCACHEKCTKRRRINQQAIDGNEGLFQAPAWSHNLVLLPELAGQGFAEMSDGMAPVDACQVMRHRRPNTFTDGARWSVPLTAGKHVFEIIWLWGERGSCASVGLGTGLASLKVKGAKSLVGIDEASWGLDFVKRRVYHGGKVFGGQYPPDGSFVPDRVLMYVDMDEGKLGFGSDVKFWGNNVTNLPTHGSCPLYVIVGTDKWQSNIRVYYKGSANKDGGLQPGPSAVLPAYSEATASKPPPGYMEVDPAPQYGSNQNTEKNWTGTANPSAPPQPARYSPPPAYAPDMPPPV